jgi:hypothetical protein
MPWPQVATSGKKAAAPLLEGDVGIQRPTGCTTASWHPTVIPPPAPLPYDANDTVHPPPRETQSKIPRETVLCFDAICAGATIAPPY